MGTENQTPVDVRLRGCSRLRSNSRPMTVRRGSQSRGSITAACVQSCAVLKTRTVLLGSRHILHILHYDTTMLLSLTSLTGGDGGGSARVEVLR